MSWNSVAYWQALDMPKGVMYNGSISRTASLKGWNRFNRSKKPSGLLLLRGEALTLPGFGE
jgi:hypothetical protein